MAESSSTSNPLAELNNIVSNTIALVTQLQDVLAKATSEKESGNSSSENNLDAVALARDSASLIKAHSTKISLLIINKPFTPTAITKVLRELVAGPLPALVSAVELCHADQYTRAVRKDLSWRCGRVLKEFKELVQRIPSDGEVLTDAKKNGSSGKAAEKRSIPVTGLLWATCDDVISLSKPGVAGYLVHKVEQYRDTLKDIMEELKEWGEEVDDEDEGDDDEESNGANPSGAEDSNVGQLTESLEATHIADTQAMLDDLLDSQQHIPRDDPDRIRERLDSCLRRLRLTALLYQALIKRRLKTLPPFPSLPGSDVPSRLDEIIDLLKSIPDRFGNLAMAFYDLDPQAIDGLMDECFFDAFAASELLAKPWTSQKDEFTDWAKKFQVEIKKG